MALLCDASNEYINCGSGASIDNLSPFTYIIWFTSSLAATSFPLVKSNGTADTKRVIIRTTGEFRLHIDTSGTDREYKSATGRVVANVWTCIALTYNASGGANNTMDLYYGDLNTLMVEETSYSATEDGTGTDVDESGGNLILGNTYDFSGSILGKMGKVQIYNTELTLAQIQSLQNDFRVLNSNCVGYWDLYGTGTQPDWSGNGNNGTVTGATVADHVPLGPPFGVGLGWQGAFTAAAGGGRIMSSLAAHGGLAGPGGIAGPGGGLAAQSKFDEIRQRHMMKQLLAAENKRKFEGRV